MPAYYLTEQQVKWLQELLDAHRNTIQGGGQLRQDTERSWDAQEDHQAPEVYIAYPQDDPDADSTAGAGTGTYWQRTPSIVIPGIQRATTEEEYDKISYGLCDIYRIIPEGADKEDELRPICGRSQKEECRQRVYNLSETSIVDRFVAAIRDKFGNYIAIQSSGNLIKCMLAEDHPGRYTPGDTDKIFKVWPGTYCSKTPGWLFPVDDDAEKWDCVDTFNEIDPWPRKYSQLWCIVMPADPSLELRDNIVYHAVSGDCSYADDKNSWKLPCD